MESGEKRTTSIPPGIAAAAAYFFPFIGGLVMLAIEKENRFVRFHAAQSIVFWVCTIIVVALLSWIPIIGSLVGLVVFVVWVFLMYEAWTDKEFEIPYLGAIARKQVFGQEERRDGKTEKEPPAPRVEEEKSAGDESEPPAS
jgi:uncharacterized membrane protein